MVVSTFMCSNLVTLVNSLSPYGATIQVRTPTAHHPESPVN